MLFISAYILIDNLRLPSQPQPQSRDKLTLSKIAAAHLTISNKIAADPRSSVANPPLFPLPPYSPRRRVRLPAKSLSQLSDEPLVVVV
jgi:hypothetical protein